ncbi:Phosphatidylinositol 4-kinase type II subunit alpha [Rasamsonia emersonii CBS 393.64]|uniref:Phosphatidylinositol 4-kinase n=1 Tax=Rasamsonia emersonii (strain ATCC 16479 / CBS 393.64 / IMI 116815) TaxID=1408163 RepID=A0A0F4YRM9_RASE3|nr:Phosphatidylinositol 4-kinase type II subunit alpha [Rasamsonia emersonii CBS 393.64]KKA20947.1 Phosphatidylinositol 4-kinase type II subunit alpha [Rasamsonia emersonii CBS 393.64]
MPKQPRPATSGYARLAQAEEEERDQGYYDSLDEDDPYDVPRTLSTSTPQYAPISARAPGTLSPPEYRRKSNGHYRRRKRSNSTGVDIKAINARLERWAEEIASKFKIHKGRGKSSEDEKLEIYHTVFQPPDGVRPYTAEMLESDEWEKKQQQARAEFEAIVESVRTAIDMGIHPKMISQGSSGSYFARNPEGKIVGVFKPKDEEPYASRNPKWTKWLHRNLFPCCFGRACLIPNLSYVSEAAAYVLDCRLRTNIVPYTDIVWLSSKSFYYDFWDRRKAWGGRKPLPAKVGSFQVFLKGYKDATVFLREHPWPDQTNSGFRAEDAPKRKKRPWNEACRPSGIHSDDEEDEYDDAHVRTPSPQDEEPRFYWTENLKQSFREELEKLVILDYIMRNTDRGLDNWMIKVDWKTEEVSIVADPPKTNGLADHDHDHDTMPPARPVSVDAERNGANRSTSSLPYKRHETMVATSRTGTPSSALESRASIKIGAIDNSLSWPWKHPDAVGRLVSPLSGHGANQANSIQWRSFPFGWLFLPVSLIGQPFSQKTRDHFLPLLTSTAWWSGTQTALRRVFSQDADFKESMFAKQIAVMKGQAWNVVETLKQPDHGPLELTRRTRVCVWDDRVDIPVAIPLRGPSTEAQRRRARKRGQEQEEMDISAAISSEQAQENDLLSWGSPPSELPNPNRFELARGRRSAELGSIGEEGGSPRESTYSSFDDSRELARSWAVPSSRPRGTKAGSDSGRPERSGRHGRQSSLSHRRSSNPWAFGGDDLEGDLGYAAAEGMEGTERKVIVERLETVKSKNPVFTWC